ncbi:MAG: zf-HC2 domain-containing protein, partial [Candidatus Eisenbacteria bacterium]|nr:zf-HC2 domain-containing protein [Candidatus Eisenbacteria bacterium]
MNCKCARNLFSPRLDGQLDYREQHRLSEHLESCATCAAEFRKFERTVGLVRTLPEEQAPPEFLHDVLERVREARRVPVPVEEPGLWERLRAGLVTLGWSPRVAVAALSFGLVVGIGGSVLLLRSSTPGVGSPSVAVSQQQIAPSLS